MDIRESYLKCIEKMLKDEFRGYDPYDGANSKYTIIQKYYYPRLFSTYFNKFSPFNIRRLLGICPTIQNQTIGFVGMSLINYYEQYKEYVEHIADRLLENSLIKRYGYHAWDMHGFPIQLRGRFQEAGTTDMGNEIIGRFFLELHKRKPEEKYKDICISVREYFLKQFLAKNENITFFKYTPSTPEYYWCYNASTSVAAYCVLISRYFNIESDYDIIEKAFTNVISKQKPQGEWWYSFNMKSGYEKPQIDFHQGFILDTLLEYMESVGYNEPYLNSYKIGLEFYRKKQFLPNGQGVYRYPKKYPVNIQNQAQGIISFSRAAAAGFGESYREFARIIAEWTINNMQDRDGHFYYLKYPLFTNKIPYIRWSDASMAYALAVYLKTQSKH